MSCSIDETSSAIIEADLADGSHMHAEVNLSTQSVPSFLHSTLYNVRIKKQIWQPPALHRDISSPFHQTHTSPTNQVDVESKFEAHREETFYELFYDLIFVAAAIQIGHVVQSDITVDGLLKTSLLFFVTRATWSQLMAYQNRLDNSDIVHYVLYLLQAICAFLMAEHITIDEVHSGWDREENLMSFSLAAAISRFSLVVMHLQVVSLSKKYRAFFVAICISQFLGAIFYMVPVLIFDSRSQYFIPWILAICSEGFGIMIYFRFCVPKDQYIPWHMGHLMRREGTFIFLILGEAIIQLVQHPGGRSADDYVRGLTGFTTCFNVGVMYYQQQLVEKEVVKSYAQRSTSHTWMLLHIILSLFILFFASGIKLVYDTNEEGDDSHGEGEYVEDRQLKEEILMCTSAAISLGIIFFLRLQYKGVPLLHMELMSNRTLSYCFRFFMSALCAAIPLVTRNATHTSVTLCVITSVLVVQEIFSYKKLRSPSFASSISILDSLRHSDIMSTTYSDWEVDSKALLMSEEEKFDDEEDGRNLASEV